MLPRSVCFWATSPEEDARTTVTAKIRETLTDSILRSQLQGRAALFPTTFEGQRYNRQTHFSLAPYSDHQVTVSSSPEEDSLPRQPIAHEHRDLFHPEVRRFRADVRQMVEAGFQRYGRTVGTHPRDARP